MATDVAQDRLGDLFVREGLISGDQLAEALADAKQSGTRLGYSLVKLELVEETALTRMLSKQYRVPAIELDKGRRLPVTWSCRLFTRTMRLVR